MRGSVSENNGGSAGFAWNSGSGADVNRLKSRAWRSSKPPTHNMRYDLQDFILRALILLAGGLAAALLAIKGYGQALPAVAVGGALGAFFAGRVQPRIED